MKKWMQMILLLQLLGVPAAAVEINAPQVPSAGAALMPEEGASFSDALLELVSRALENLHPDLAEAAGISAWVICAAVLVASLSAWKGNAKFALDLAGTIAVASAMLSSTNAMILLAKDTLLQLSDYGKLLFPVMTAALAAQGGITASTGLYIGTAFFNTLLESFLSVICMPMVYVYLALAVAGSACGENMLKRLKDIIKNTISWLLKTMLTVFTTYMSITGVVSGTTDAAALKATKLTISTVVPVVGGILSDASEAVLVGTGVMKNAAGVYGILAVLALFLGPFLRIGIHYLMLKATAAICSIFGSKGMTGLIDDFSSSMGMLLGMTGAMCLLLLVSTVCFMKGVT